LDTLTTYKLLLDNINYNVSNNHKKDTMVTNAVGNEDFATSATNPAEIDNDVNPELLPRIVQNDVLNHVSHKNNTANVNNNQKKDTFGHQNSWNGDFAASTTIGAQIEKWNQSRTTPKNCPEWCSQSCFSWKQHCQCQQQPEQR